jgi:5'-3' exonuclease
MGLPMQVHLIDGTYELFRNYYGAPPARSPDGREVGATRGLIRSLWSLLHRGGATHLACAFDTVIESFRNELFTGYKTGEGIEPDLLSQFPLVERAVAALGIRVWSMIEFEADDALASGAGRYAGDARVERVVLCSPDKDLAQSVVGERIVCLDRRRNVFLDEAGVVAKFGVPPSSIPDWLALVGDSADGIPGIPKWGARSAAAVLREYKHLEHIPDDPSQWRVSVRGSAALASSLASMRAEADLYRLLATLRVDAPVDESVDALRWNGPDLSSLQAFCAEIGFEDFERATDSAAKTPASGAEPLGAV